MHQYVDVFLHRSLCVFGACWCVCASMLVSRATVCQRGVALSVHLSNLESSHPATPVVVRALCPPQCAALLPPSPSFSSSFPPRSFHLSSSSQLPPQLCPLAFVPLLGACPVYLTQSEQQSHPRICTHTDTHDAHEYCMHADTRKWLRSQNKNSQTWLMRSVPCVSMRYSHFLKSLLVCCLDLCETVQPKTTTLTSPVRVLSHLKSSNYTCQSATEENISLLTPYNRWSCTMTAPHS